MRKFKSNNILEVIKTVEVDGTVFDDKEEICISESFNRSSFVVFNIRGVKYTLNADEVVRAIKNAQNTHGF